MKTLLLILTLAAGTALRAGEGIIHGRIYGLDQNGSLAAIVSGAKIELQNESGATISSATSNSDGLYELTGLDAGDYRYRVTAAGYRTEDEKRGFSVTDAGRDYAHDFLLWKESPKMPEPAPAPPVAAVPQKPTVHGHVFSQDEKGMLTGMLAGAKVELLSGGKVTAMTTAEASGHYVIRDLAPGDYQYRVTAAGFEPEDKGRGFTIPAEELEYVHDFLLSPPPPKKEKCDLAILVVKRISSGKNKANDVRLPVAKAEIMLQPIGGLPTPPNQPFVTDAKGEFIVKMLGNGDYTVMVDAPECDPYSGPLKVVCDDEGQVILELQPCNELLHGYLRDMLTDGWGNSSKAKTAAERAYQRALKADTSGECGVNYVRALSELSAGAYEAAQQSLAAAIGKKSDSPVWDRACGTRLWMNLCLHRPEQAIREIRSLVRNHYVDRATNVAAEDTAYYCGVALGMVKGPWQDMVGASDAVLLESELLSGLQGEMRSACSEGRDHVAQTYNQWKAELEQERNRLLTEAIEARNAEVGRMEERQTALSRDVADLDGEIQKLDATIAQYEQLRVQAAGFAQQRLGIAAQFQPLNARLQQINVCMAQDQQEYAAMATQSPAEAAEILAEMRQHQVEIQQINQQMVLLKNQDAQMAAQAANLEAQFNRGAGAAMASRNTLLARREVMAREFDQLERERMTPFDPSKFTTPDLERAEDHMRRLTSYCDLDLESDREEMLDLFNCGVGKQPKRPAVAVKPVVITEPAFKKGLAAVNRPMTSLPASQPVPTPAANNPPVVPRPAPPAPATTPRPAPKVGDPADLVVTNNHDGGVRIFGIAPGGDNEQLVRRMERGDEAMVKVRVGQTLVIRATLGGRELMRHNVSKKLEVLKIGGQP
ncbi:MAG: carboxypeptidase regulatory-like domain-containing protein [Prosthecobacter sp.]